MFDPLINEGPNNIRVKMLIFGVKVLLGLFGIIACIIILNPGTLASEPTNNPFLNEKNFITKGVTPNSVAKIGDAETIAGIVYGKDLNKRLSDGDPIKFLDKVRVGVSSAATFRFVDNSSLTLGENSSILIDNLVFNPQSKVIEGALSITSGFLRYASSEKGSGISIQTPLATIGIRGTIFDILASSARVEVAVHKGEIELNSKSKKKVVRSGEVITLDKDDNLKVFKIPSLRIKAAATGTYETLKLREKEFKLFKIYKMGNDKVNNGLIPNKCTKNIDDIIIPNNIANTDKSKIIVMRLNTGDVFIELRNKIAPQHIERIKKLVRTCFYDGLQFFDVRPDFAAITGDPLNNGSGGSGKKIKAEFSEIPFITGSVGMIREQKKPNSADSQFFITLNSLPHLTGKYTNWGLVVSGMENIKSLPIGRPPEKPGFIEAMRLLADLPFVNILNR